MAAFFDGSIVLILALIPPGHDSAIDIPDRASDPTGFIKEQKINDSSNFFGLANAANRVEGIEFFIHFRDFFRRHNFLINIGFDHPDRDRIDSDIVAGQFHRHVLGQRMQPSLLHGIGRRRCGLDRLPGPHRANIDNRPRAIVFHIPGHSPGDKEKALIQIEISIVILLAVIQKGGRPEIPGSVYKIAHMI